MGRWWTQVPHAHLDVAPAARPIGHQIAAETGVKIQQQVLVERTSGEDFLIKGGLGQCDPLGEKRG